MSDRPQIKFGTDGWRAIIAADFTFDNVRTCAQALADDIFGRIREGWQAAHDGLLQATGQSRLLESNPALETSIRLRLPYIEPLNLLQVELLKRHRAGEEDPRIKEGIELSINAIATALRNSG